MSFKVRMRMKHLLVAPLILGLTSPIQADNIDPKILCIRNQVKYDLEREAYIKYVAFQYEREQREFDLDTFNESVKLGDVWFNAQKAERRALIPILKLAGYEKPNYYLKIFELPEEEVIKRWGYKPYETSPEYKKAQDYFIAYRWRPGWRTQKNLCKLYGVEFDNRDDDIQRLEDRYEK